MPARANLSALLAAPAPGPATPRPAPLSLGAAFDRALPGGGLARGALHDIAGSGAQTEDAAAPALFAAACLARAGNGPVLWVRTRHPPAIYPPALAAVGLHPDRVIYAEARRPEAVLAAMEDALRHTGLDGVVGELFGRLTLTASRRLQLAAEASGIPALLIRRSRRFDDPVLAEPCAAATRWRIAALPSAPPIPEAPDIPGLGRPRWHIALIRCRGGMPATWQTEGPDAEGRLGVPADMADRPAATQQRRRSA